MTCPKVRGLRPSRQVGNSGSLIHGDAAGDVIHAASYISEVDFVAIGVELCGKAILHSLKAASSGAELKAR